jgi:dihydrofolate reductase
MVIGGAEIYRAALPLAQRIFLTEVHAKVAGDVYFPELRRDDWRETSRESFTADARHAYPYSFVVLERRAAALAPSRGGRNVGPDAEHGRA